ncbi:sporulation protein YjcZ [Paenibacillus xerothermodurans]|uniref:Sporulation protein YjcZ n=1 Tax=Paenibacillus xerothermodurans TaxID=1977292 RepID=A0A2W1NCB7_PAEXE|nr:sporulation protein YjcZ [Paenibacillus xerothermodurans]PZE22117.1 sporulation protein YjcZ [Paenibacillus xerothermodurans]
MGYGAGAAGAYGGLFTSVGVILVLYILLVIIAKSWVI